MSRKKYNPKTEAPNPQGFSPTDRLMAFELAVQGGTGTPKSVDSHRLKKGKSAGKTQKLSATSKKIGKGWFK